MHLFMYLLLAVEINALFASCQQSLDSRQRKGYELRRCSQTQLTFQIRAVDIDRAHAEVQLRRNLLGVFSASQSFHDLNLALRQHCI